MFSPWREYKLYEYPFIKNIETLHYPLVIYPASKLVDFRLPFTLQLAPEYWLLGWIRGMSTSGRLATRPWNFGHAWASASLDRARGAGERKNSSHSFRKQFKTKYTHYFPIRNKLHCFWYQFSHYLILPTSQLLESACFLLRYKHRYTYGYL